MKNCESRSNLRGFWISYMQVPYLKFYGALEGTCQRDPYGLLVSAPCAVISESWSCPLATSVTSLKLM